MSILRKDYRPPLPSERVPGRPGHPGTPAYCVDNVSIVPGERTIFVNDPGDPLTGRPPGVIAITVSTGPVEIVTRTCYEGTPPIAPEPDTMTAPVAARFYEGWNASADSISSMAANGELHLTIADDAVGIVCGLTSDPNGSGYWNIEFGFYFDNGSVQIIEGGATVSASIRFDGNDEFVIRRVAGAVAYLVNGSPLFTSTRLSTATLYADASLYMGQDRITNAFFTAASVPLPPPGSGPLDPVAPPGPFPPDTPPGERPRYSSIVGYLRQVAGFSSNLDGGWVNPGAPPGTGTPIDPATGDWDSRSGGSLRQLVPTALANFFGDYNEGSIAGELRALAGAAFGSEGDGTHYAISESALPGLTVEAGANTLTPHFAICDGVFGGVVGFALALTGTNGAIEGRLNGVRGFAATIAGGFVDVGGAPTGVDANGDWPGRSGGQLRQLVPLIFDSASMLLHGGMDGVGPAAELLGLAHQPNVDGGAYGLDALAPLPTLDGYDAATLDLVAPLPTLEFVLLPLPASASLDREGPVAELEASGTTTGLGRIDGIAPLPTIDAFSSGGLQGEGPYGELEAHAFSGGTSTQGVVLGVDGDAPLPSLEIGAASGLAASLDGEAPLPLMLWGGLNGVAPLPLMQAGSGAGLDAASASHEAYAITLIASGEGMLTAASHYTDYPFERLVRFGSIYYGVGVDGIFELTGDTFGGSPIVAEVEFPPHDFATRDGGDRASAIKQMASVLLAGRIGANLELDITLADGEEPATYTYTVENPIGARNHRVDVGLGLEARFLGASLRNPEGEPFELTEIAPEFFKTRRKVWQR